MMTRERFKFVKVVASLKIPRQITDSEAWGQLSEEEMQVFALFILDFYSSCESEGFIKIEGHWPRVNFAKLQIFMDRFVELGLISYRIEAEGAYYKINNFDEMRPQVFFQNPFHLN